MTRWNAHQKLAAAIRRMAHFENQVRTTRKRRDAREKKINTTVRVCLLRAYYDVQNHLRGI